MVGITVFFLSVCVSLSQESKVGELKRAFADSSSNPFPEGRSDIDGAFAAASKLMSPRRMCFEGDGGRGTSRHYNALLYISSITRA